MRITLYYENSELKAIEDMGKELDRKAGLGGPEGPAEEIRRQVSVLSPYIKVDVVPTNDGGLMVTADVSVDFIRDICGTIRSYAQQVVDAVNAAMSMVKAFGAVSPMISGLKDIFRKAVSFKLEKPDDGIAA